MQKTSLPIQENGQQIHSEKANLLKQSNLNEINTPCILQLKQCQQISKKYSQSKIFDGQKLLQMAFNHWKIRKLCYYMLLTLVFIVLVEFKFQWNIFEIGKAIQINSKSNFQSKNAEQQLGKQNIQKKQLRKNKHNLNSQEQILAEEKQFMNKQLNLLDHVNLSQTQKESNQKAKTNLNAKLSNTTTENKINRIYNLKDKQQIDKNNKINQTDIQKQLKLQKQYQLILEQYRKREQLFQKYHPEQLNMQQIKKQAKSDDQLIGITLNQLDLASRLVDLKNSNNESLAQQQKQYYQTTYNISQYQQLPFCIVIPSYNNVFSNRHINNIKSIIQQSYSNYHIVFIDDASTDSTGQDVLNYLNQQQIVTKDRYVVIRNQAKMQAMANLRLAAFQYCQAEEIFMIIDGDDQLIGKQVLKLFNAVFHQSKSWFVYSNFITITGNIGYSRPFPKEIMQKNAYRYYPFVSSHLRAFYTQLFRNIKDEDLQDNSGLYLKAANDVAICLPILQQSHQRVSYISQITYFYNSDTGLNNHNIRSAMQKNNEKMIKQRPSYPSITNMYNSPFSVFYAPLPGSHPTKILTPTNDIDKNQNK